MNVVRACAAVVLGLMSAAAMGQGAALSAADDRSEQQVRRLAAKLDDWAQLGYYREANKTVPPPAAGEQRVVFYGASVVEFWKTRGEFFPGKPYIDRGIGGQTTPQLLVRFRQDVIDLHPKAVVILGGSNDIAGNSGPMTLEMTEGNWQSMAELARASGIAVVFASLPPSKEFPWKMGLKPAEKIRALNAWLKEYCARTSAVYLDVHSAMTDADGGMKEGLSVDGVHPTATGYAVMQPLAQAAIDQALKQKTMVQVSAH